eukprot:GFYU01007542.1.p1 GENE.GFYU01007542.1~~GFYU01007542.1.p1  ORF type:complete len:183 (-),score=48.14 GFYU01007542.1:76-624(-)
MKDLSVLMQELGKNVSDLAAFDKNSHFKVLGEHLTGSLSEIYGDMEATETINLHDPIKDYIYVSGGVKDVMDNRIKAEKAISTSKAALEAETAKYAKRKDRRDSSLDKSEKLIADTKDKVERVQAEYTYITHSLAGEMDSFNDKKTQDFKEIVSNYAMSQIHALEQAQAVWHKVLQDVDSVK